MLVSSVLFIELFRYLFTKQKKGLPVHGKALYNLAIKFNLKYYNTFPFLKETTTHHHIVTGVFHMECNICNFYLF